jgi:hypothetical protein
MPFVPFSASTFTDPRILGGGKSSRCALVLKIVSRSMMYTTRTGNISKIPTTKTLYLCQNTLLVGDLQTISSIPISLSFRWPGTRAYLGGKEELQGSLLKVKLDEQGHIVGHVERDLACERG